MKTLSGYKTYIFGILIVVFAVLFGLGMITQETFLAFITLLGGGGFISMRSAIAKIRKS